jgi:hypothetical protein
MQLDREVTLRGVDDRVLGPRREPHVLLVLLLVVVCEADAAGVEEHAVRDRPRPLHVHVSAGDDVCVDVGDCRASLVLGRGRKKDLVERRRRAVHRQERAAAAELERERRWKGTDPPDAVGPELRPGPAGDLELLLRRRLDAGVEFDQEGVRVPEHDRAAEREETVEALPRLRSALNGVAEADVALDGAIGRVCQERLEPDEVAVDVGEDRRPQNR